MTLVIAGYQYEKAFRWKSEVEDSSTRREWALAPSGIYLAADSAITDSLGKTLLSGFRKIYPVRAVVWEPYFVGQHFRSYLYEYQAIEVAVAFAGSTLSAQHYMNFISEHLANLRITFLAGPGPIQYRICLPCEPNPLTGPESYAFDEDVFTRADYANLLTAEVIANAVLHALKHALRSARKYKLDEAGFKSLFTDFVLAAQCPLNRSYHLFHLPMNAELVNGVMQPTVTLREVPHDEVVVLGMRGEFLESANATRLAAMKSGEPPDMALFNFLTSAIGSVKGRGESGIDYPAVMKVLKNGGLETVARTAFTKTSAASLSDR